MLRTSLIMIVFWNLKNKTIKIFWRRYIWKSNVFDCEP